MRSAACCSRRTGFDARPGQSYAIVVVGKATSIADLVNPAKSGKFTLPATSC
jgi:hypothetical protein